MSALLTVDDLNVTFATPRGRLQALNSVSFEVDSGEVLALVGESGSGKSTIGLSILGLLGPEASVSGGALYFKGQDLSALSQKQFQTLRGNSISIVFQDPFTSLNPSLTIGFQISEILSLHKSLSADQVHDKVIAAMTEVGLRNPESLAKAYPHQLSGGMKQRVLIASALVCEPELLILDEPTTALDVTVEAQIIDLINEIREKRSLGVLFITHNLGIVNRFADRVCVLYAGRVVETGPKKPLFSAPQMPYTKGLLASIPHLTTAGRRAKLDAIKGRLPNMVDPPTGCIFQARCPFAEGRCGEAQPLVELEHGQFARCWKAAELVDSPWPTQSVDDSAAKEQAGQSSGTLVEVHNLRKTFRIGSAYSNVEWRRIAGVIPWPKPRPQEIHALDDISLAINSGEVLGLVGESGSGKSTLGRALLRLLRADDGRVAFDGSEVLDMKGGQLSTFRRRAQIIFQNPDSSLNPRRTVGDAVARAVSLFHGLSGQALRARTEELLEQVGLGSNYYDRYPHQLSGGEKQRVGIARALAPEPSFIVCDESVSALDVSVQATVLNLLDELKDRLGLSYLFISHDLSVVAHISDRIAVMYAGRIVESGPTDAVLKPPFHPYTKALLSAAPTADPNESKPERIVLDSDGPEMQQQGCQFQNRCSQKISGVCDQVTPTDVELSPGHFISCHRYNPDDESSGTTGPMTTAVDG